MDVSRPKEKAGSVLPGEVRVTAPTLQSASTVDCAATKLADKVAPASSPAPTNKRILVKHIFNPLWRQI
jgi:hypothetical protein